MSKLTSTNAFRLTLGVSLFACAAVATAQPRSAILAAGQGDVASKRRRDQAIIKPVVFTRAVKKGRALIVLPGEIKGNNATFLQKFG
jgi:hypothetical protein